MAIPDPDLRRTWIFGAGADRAAHIAMIDSGADALIVDLEDFTPPQRRGEARELLEHFVQDCRARQRVAAIRINALEADGMIDLAAAMRAARRYRLPDERQRGADARVAYGHCTLGGGTRYR
jgi:citrate lyase subunit beta / citryl-CoA lyase